LGSRVAKLRNLLVKEAFSPMQYNGQPEYKADDGMSPIFCNVVAEVVGQA
jgi:hypothetical protein